MRPIPTNVIARTAVLIEGYGGIAHQPSKPIREIQVELIQDHLGTMPASSFWSVDNFLHNEFEGLQHLLPEGMNFTIKIVYNEIDQHCPLM